MIENQKQLILKAQQSLKAAQYLLQGNFYDYAVVRAYYTMFYLASAFLAGENLYFSKHSAVISAFGREFAKNNKIPRKFHQYLREAQDLRNLGDYGEIDLIDLAEAKVQILRAEEFLLFTQTELNYNDC